MNRIGPMRYRVTVQEKTETVNSFGERQIVWADLYINIPASDRWLSTKELQEANARQSEVSIAFEFWAANVPNISSEHRILFDGDVYELEPPSFHGRQHEFVQVKGMKGLTDG